jgi:hypothetical protein
MVRHALATASGWPHMTFLALLVCLDLRRTVALAVAPGMMISERRELLTARRSGGSENLGMDMDTGILVQGIASNDVLFNHLAKCGGTFVQKVIKASVNNAIIQKEHMGLDSHVLIGHPFVIGLVRNPFDYYVSLWAYTSEPSSCCFVHQLTREQQLLTLARRAPYGEYKDDAVRFRNWLRIVSSEELGLMSLRFWGSYLQMDGDVFANFQHALATEQGINATSRDINRALHSFRTAAVTGGKASDVDCYVHTEDLDGGLRACLQRYEREANGTVDWAAFRKHLDTHRHNLSPHAACGKLYDEETYRFVERSDRHLLRAFNYTRCGGDGL